MLTTLSGPDGAPSGAVLRLLGEVNMFVEDMELAGETFDQSLAFALLSAASAGVFAFLFEREDLRVACED